MTKRTRIILVVAGVVVVLLAALAFSAVVWAKDLQRDAYAGKDSAQAGVRSLASQNATAAIVQFASARDSFDRVQSSLGAGWVTAVAATIPWAGRQYAAVSTLAAMGVDGSTAGFEIATALREASSTPVPEGSSRLAALLKGGRGHIDAAFAALTDAAERVGTLKDEGLDPRLSSAVRSIREALAGVAPFLDRSRAFLALERYLLASHHRILVISQNSAELRPTGGFAGTFGILDIGPEGLALEKYRDVYTLPDPPKPIKPPPGLKVTNVFAFRDANWWMDFPTSAETMLGFWKTAHQASVDGIIAVDVVAVRDLLAITGPVRVEGFGETFTASNLLDKLLYLVEVKSGGGARKKDVLVALAEEVENRLLSSGSGDMARYALAIANSADQKHVQFYFTDAAVQSAVVSAGWSGSMSAPAGTTDILGVCNAMTLPGKVNIATRKTASYAVALQRDGSAESTLSLRYWSVVAKRTYHLSGSSWFRDYLRVYRAPGTQLAVGAGRSSATARPTTDTGLPAIVDEFLMDLGGSHDVTIATTIPRALRSGPPATFVRAPQLVPATGEVSYYRLFLIRQADLRDTETTVTVAAPVGWDIVGAAARMLSSGAVVASSVTGGAARLSMPLSSDIVFDVVLRRE
jgi:hypothetical protein